MQKFINPYTDYGFKKLFGEETSKPLLIDFLNSMLPAHHQIADLAFKNTEQLGQSDADRKAIYDIYCESTTGERFIVELQRAKQAYFKERTLYYATFPIVEQSRRGNDWLFDLKAIYCISILDFALDDSNNDVIQTIKLKDQHNRIFYDKLTFIYLEVPKFTKTETQLITQLDKWLFFIKNLQDLQVIPMMLQNHAIFEKAFKTAELANLNRDEWLKYEYSLKTYRDNLATELYAKEQAFNEGLEKGLEKGQQQRNVEIAKNLKNLNMSPEYIQQATGLSLAEIAQLWTNLT